MENQDLIYVEENVWYGKKHKKKKKRIGKLIVLAVLLLAGYFYYTNRIVTQIIAVCKSYVSSYITTSVNSAVFKSMDNSVNYSDVVTVFKDGNGDISLITVDNLKVNKICREIAVYSQNNLSEYENMGIPMPIGTLTGISLLSGIGSDINLKIVATGIVTADFVSVFKSVGINQTLHSIYVKVHSTVNLDIPLSKSSVSGIIEVLLCESVLVGKVPQFYLS